MLFDDPPVAGDGPRWEAIFAAAFADLPGVGHRAFAWDDPDGAEGAVDAEFVRRGYELERSVALVAAPAELVAHPRASTTIDVRALDPGADEPLWEAEIGLLCGEHDPATSTPEGFAAFIRDRQRERRELFAAGRGAWYAALDADGTLVAGCGVVAVERRGRFQSVVVDSRHRGRGIASRLVLHAARDAAARFALQTLVIVADADYHALPIYRSLGFRDAERVCQILRPARG